MSLLCCRVLLHGAKSKCNMDVDKEKISKALICFGYDAGDDCTVALYRVLPANGFIDLAWQRRFAFWFESDVLSIRHWTFSKPRRSQTV